MATITASSISSSDSLERFRQEFNTLRSDVSNIQSGSLTITNESNNRILTSVSENTFNAEESLTFDGTTFSVGGAMTVSGLTTLSGNLVIPNAGNIGSAGDNDAIAIASNGVVTFSQTPVFPDGSLPVVDLDIDGATDIGAALADADLFIVDDGAGGTNRKTAASRIKTYIADVTLTTAAQTNITSLGTLTTLTVDNIIINGTNIGHTSDTDAIAIASDGVVTMNQIPVFSAGINVSGGTIAGTLATAAQTNITSLGTLTGLTISGDVTFTGDSYNAVWDKSDNRLEFADNAQAAFGAGADLRIYHSGSNSYIDESGTGALIFKSNIYSFRNAADNEQIALFTENGSVDLYYDNSKKLETTSAGIDVTGTVTSDGADLDGAVVINESSADVDFRVESNGNANMLFVDAGNDRVGIGTNAPGQPLEIFSNTAEVSLNSSSSTYSRFVHKHNGTAMWTTGTRAATDYHIFRESGSGNVVIDHGTLNLGGNDTGNAGLLNVYGGATGEGGEIRIHPSGAEDSTIDSWSIDVATDDLRIFSSVGDLAIVAVANGSTSLYHDGSGKLSTSSGGIVVTGTVSATAGSTLLIVNSSGTTLKTIKGMS